MPLEPDTLGIQTYSFRGFQGRTILEKVRECGLSRVELCTMQVNWGIPDARAQVLQDYRAAGITIDALGVHQPGGPFDEVVCAFAKEAGAKVIGIDIPPSLSLKPFHAAERLAERYDLRFAIHNHGGYHWLGSRQMLAEVFQHTGPRIGLCLDTAWAMHAGENYLELIEQFGSRLYGLHIKDFAFDRAGHTHDVVIGTGNLDLPQLARALDAVGFAGYAALEYEGEPENPVPAIRACVQAAHKELVHA